MLPVSVGVVGDDGVLPVDVVAAVGDPAGAVDGCTGGAVGFTIAGVGGTGVSTGLAEICAASLAFLNQSSYNVVFFWSMAL